MTVLCEELDNLGSDGAPVRLGIMGGTFDPIHIGHLRIAEEMREELELDAVVFIPAGDPVFKRDHYVADAQVRLSQVRAAIAGNPYFYASPIEIDRDGGTYTVETLRELRANFPESVQFYFIIGSDAAATIGKWRGFAEIATLTHLAVAVGRPGSPGADELRETILAAAPFDLHIVRTSALEISSHVIRERVAQGKSVRYLMPAVISERYVREAEARARANNGEIIEAADVPENASGDADDAEPLSKEFFKARKAELKERVGSKRFEHSLNVSETCVKLAKLYGVDAKKARIAGLLHDWDKGYDDDQARARVRELGMEGEINPAIVERMPGVLHGITAARALGNEFPGIPADILQAISRHTTAAPDMSPLDMVLYIADAIEPGRQFGRIDELRAAVGKVTLEELYFQTYEYWVFLLFDRRKPLHPDTIRIWNDFTSRLPHKGKHGSGDGSVSGKKTGKHKK